MTHFDLLLIFCFGLYFAECSLWVGEGSWLLTAWHKRFSMWEGPTFRLRNPFPLGFACRFPVLTSEPSLSLKEARRRWRRYQPWGRALHGYARVLILVVLLALMLFEIRRGFGLAWGLLAFLFAFIHLTLVQIFWRAYGVLYPGPRGTRIWKTFLCLVSPWQSSRAADLLEDQLLEGFHPLVAASLLLSGEDFWKLSRRWLLELRYPAVLKAASAVRPLLKSSAPEEEETLSQWLAESRLDLGKLLAPPARLNPSDQSYCPRCDLPYQLAQGSCKDCGRSLLPF